MKRWSYGGCFGGLMIERDGDGVALVEIGPHARRAPSTGYKIARRMVRLLNAGEAALSSSLDAVSSDLLERLLNEEFTAAIRGNATEVVAAFKAAVKADAAKLVADHIDKLIPARTR